MSFDKKKYRQNREAGLRGQGPIVALEPKIALWSQADFDNGKCEQHDIGKPRVSNVEMHSRRIMGPDGTTRFEQVAVTRRMKRQRIRARYYKPDRQVLDPTTGLKKTESDSQGKLFTHKGVHHKKGVKRPLQPVHSPDQSNHTRHVLRRTSREAQRAK